MLQIFGIDYGMKDKNPIDNVYFYCKNDPSNPIQIRKEEVCIKPHLFTLYSEALFP